MYDDGLERRYKKAAVAYFKAIVWYLPGRYKGKQSISQDIQTRIQ